MLNLLACPKCHSPFVRNDGALSCPKCALRFPVREGIPDFRPAEFAARFVAAQAAESEHHEQAWTQLQTGHLPLVQSIPDYRDWLESFYRNGLYVFGFPAAWLRDKVVLEIGSGPFGLLACLPHGQGVAVDPLMPMFVPYMRPHWQPSPLRIAALGEELPVQDGAFDAAVAINCLDHTLEPDRILTAVTRALKPGGYFFLMNNVKSVLGVALVSFGEKFGIKRLTEVYHPHAFSQGSLTAACRAAGLEVIQYSKIKTSEPPEILARYGWKGSIRKRMENECGLWLLARKPQ